MYVYMYVYMYVFIGMCMHASKRWWISNNLQSPILTAGNGNPVNHLKTANLKLILLQPDLLLQPQLRQLHNINFPLRIQIRQILTTISSNKNTHIINKTSIILHWWQVLPIYWIGVEGTVLLWVKYYAV